MNLLAPLLARIAKNEISTNLEFFLLLKLIPNISIGVAMIFDTFLIGEI